MKSLDFERIESSLSFIESLEKSISDFDVKFDTEEFGIVVAVSDGIAKIEGIEKVKMMELIKFQCGAIGIALGLNFDSVDVIILSNSLKVKEGQKVFRTDKVISVKIGPELLGRVVDVMGNAIDGKGEIETKLHSKIEVEAPSILDRKSVDTPFETGILAIDAAIPIGRGQRELIIGDRQTGKTTIAFDSMINQCILNKHKHDKDKVYSIYVAIGQKRSTVVKMVHELEEKNLMKDCIFVVASASDSAAMQFIAPYTACTMAEYFRDNGMHALIVYDDLSKHAVAYREISLLLKRPPAREAYPGDIFYLHSRLLERSANLSDENGGGSLTCFPIIETQAGDISGYIPTNVVSITDGQIFLETNLFYQGIRPAINIGISVSRIGSAAQFKGIKEVAGRLKIQLAQYRELESFAKFGSDLDEETIKILDNGKKIMKVLVQKNGKPLSVYEQIVLLYIISRNDLLKDISIEQIEHLSKKISMDFVPKNLSILEKVKFNGFKDCKKEFATLIEEFLIESDLVDCYNEIKKWINGVKVECKNCKQIIDDARPRFPNLGLANIDYPQVYLLLRKLIDHEVISYDQQHIHDLIKTKICPSSYSVKKGNNKKDLVDADVEAFCALFKEKFIKKNFIEGHPREEQQVIEKIISFGIDTSSTQLVTKLIDDINNNKHSELCILCKKKAAA